MSSYPPPPCFGVVCGGGGGVSAEGSNSHHHHVARDVSFVLHDALESSGILASHARHVTASGCKNMTKCSREIWEIEAVMAGAPWPLNKTSVGNDREQA
uniref:Uncharacterized protein n=1 Tax=Fagus sylvatica TaxID=28930 RepID=A0A2N9J6R7_FAGSY